MSRFSDGSEAMTNSIDLGSNGRCPACGQPNSCAAATNLAAPNCWCRSVVGPPELLARIRERFPVAACLCRGCLERERVAVKSAGL